MGNKDSNKWLGRLGLLVVCLSGTTGWGVVINAQWTLEDAQSFAGELEALRSVGWLEVHEGESTFRGSGVLVSPNWVLTAAHNWSAEAVNDIQFHLGGVAYPAMGGAWHQHPSWRAAPMVSASQGWDIALVQLALPVVGIDPAILYAGDRELGSDVILGGFGLAGTSETGPRSNLLPNFFAARNQIDRVLALEGDDHGPGGLLAIDFDSGSEEHNALSGDMVFDVEGRAIEGPYGGDVRARSSEASPVFLEGTSALGDSGGPAFADFGEGLQVVGLVSWSVNPTAPLAPYNSNNGDVAHFTRVSPFNEWIQDTMSIPEPQALILVLVAVLVFGCSRWERDRRRSAES